MLVEGAMSDILQTAGDSANAIPELTLKTLRAAVKSRLDLMDAGFLAALAAYKRAAEAKGDANTIRLFNAIREEVLLAISMRLPPAMQIVDMLVRKYSQEERDGILRTSVEGGNGADIPACTADEIALAVGQLIGEMEKMEQIPDWGLLLHLCAARERVRGLGLKDELSARELPPKQAMSRETQMCNNLAILGDRMRRKAVLKREFEKSRNAELMIAEEKRRGGRKEDEEEEDEPELFKHPGMRPFAEAAQAAKERITLAPGIRPGRFMDSLIGIIREMKKEGHPGLNNMENLLDESVEVLEELAAQNS